MFFMAFIGTGIIICLATCVVCQAIPAIVHVHVHVVKSCLLCKFEFVQCSAWFFDQATGFVFWHLSNQRLLECFYGIYRDRHFICSGNMCSLPSHPCHSYFGGARSKGFATLRNVSKLQFFDKIGQAKSVGFRFYSAI